MRIPLRILNEQLEVSAIFSAPGHHTSPNVVTFIVDTGSNRSTLGYGDVLRINLPESRLPFSEHSNIGGQSFALHEIMNAQLSFTDSEEKIQRFKLKFFASIPTKKSAKNCELAKTVPSLLGLDFLHEAKLALYCNPAKDEAYLET